MLIGIGGRAGSGKDTLGAITGQKIVKFADPLYEQVAKLLGISPLELKSSHGKNRNYSFLKNGIPTFMTGREILQYVGTDVCRAFDEDYFVKLLPFAQNITITDVRFPNEIRAIKRNDGILIYVQRELNKSDFRSHSSENAVDAFGFDFVIDNDGTIDDLTRKFHEIKSKL